MARNKTKTQVDGGVQHSVMLDKIKRNSNVFVLGDLVIDHTAFVTGVTPVHPMPVSGEMAFRVKRRLDTAGGAATTARTINALIDGKTFLWGLVGSSPWGTFRSILELSQALDGAKNRIEFRGVHDETEAPMTTISRLVAVHDSNSGRERYERKARFADYDHIHIPIDRQISAIRHHLDRIHRTKAPLDCIVLNDLDFGALHHNVVNEISSYALAHQIPMLVRARRDASKYAQVPISVFVCTLPEWKVLVGAKEDVEYWNQNIDNADVAEEFARRSLAVFRHASRFVVLVGDDWIDKFIVIQRPESSGEACQVAVEPGLPKLDKGKSQQVGASDVFAGALALSLSARVGSMVDFAGSLDLARLVTQAYQRTRWHHVPHLEALVGELLEAKSGNGHVTEYQFGTPYLPSSSNIDMALAKTSIPDIYTVTPIMSTALNSLLKQALEDDKSLVLVASGGSGKSAIAKQIIANAKASGLEACSLNELGVDWSWNTPKKTVAEIAVACKARSTNRPFVVIDEALKFKGGEHVSTKGVVLLNEAQEMGVRFLLIDADFAKIDAETLKSQFARRVSWHQLPSAWDRPLDIPYVFASCLRSVVTQRDTQFSIEASALVAIIEWMLHEKKNYGNLATLAKEIVAKHRNTDTVRVVWNDLPETIKRKSEPYRVPNVADYIPRFE